VLGSLNTSVRQIRTEMGLSQSELASLVGIGVRAIQSYEQEWRQPSEMVKRTLLLLLVAHRNGTELSQMRCWEQKTCSPGVCEKCIAYATRQGHLCWFLTGTICAGRSHKNWTEKMEVCLGCSFLQQLLDPSIGRLGSIDATE
jgi:DNA-binding XRE family transcriptional regulator